MLPNSARRTHTTSAASASNETKELTRPSASASASVENQYFLERKGRTSGDYRRLSEPKTVSEKTLTSLRPGRSLKGAVMKPKSLFSPRSALRGLALLGTLLCLLSAESRANLAEMYGLGSRSAALGGATAASPGDAFSATHNPAALGIRRDKRLELSFGLVAMRPLFDPIDGVLVENKVTSDKNTFGNVERDYRDTFGQLLGARLGLAPGLGNLSFGLTAFVPLVNTTTFDTGETFVPEFVLHRARTQRVQIDFAVGAELAPRLTLGVGAHLGFSLTSNAEVFLQSTASKPSTMRFTSGLKMKAGPYAGLLYRGDRFSFGAVARAPVASPNELKLQSGARFFGDFAALDFNFTALSTMFYDPATLELGTEIKVSDSARLHAQLDWQLWNAFESPALIIQDPSTQQACPGGCGTGLTISPGLRPLYPMRNPVVPRLGAELDLSDRATVRLGFVSRASIFKTPPNDVGNALDPARSEYSVGLGLQFSELLDHAIPWRLDLHASYIHLDRVSVTKSATDEIGTASEQKIGGPGYTAGGKIFGGGLSVSLAL